MTENSSQDTTLRSAVDTLSEHTKKLEIAKYYTHGNFENAKKMVSGSYKDLYAIKGKFSSSSVYGAFLIFYNIVYFQITDYYGIISHSFDVDDIKTNVDWRIFEDEITKNLEKHEHDDVLGSHMKESVAAGLTMQFGTELKKLLEHNDQIGVNHMFQKLCQDKLGFPNLKISVDFNHISSLDMELYSTSSKKLTPDELKGVEREEEKINDIEKMEDDTDDPLGGKNVKLVLEGTLILAPIKGKEISSLSVGDRVKLNLIGKNPKAISLAKAFKAYEDGKMLPIAGRIVSIKKLPAGGYKIFVVVAKGIFIKIEEEEEQIKVLMDELGVIGASDKTSDSSISTPMIIIGVIIFLILIGVIFFFIL